ncbi:hypothetical protein [Roseovarius sp. EL26]|uniref:hypothetical protein n=1 Tax=Roseovarius sp. EL26 TaxID=2126672 RepID=UPI000EA0D3F0|nr:hypothetical protein [Roseovarius sp. EL26]
MKRLKASFRIALTGLVAVSFMASTAQANRWLETAPIDAPTAALAAKGSITLAQSQQAKTPAQLALEEANLSNAKKKKKKSKKKKKRRGSFK